MTEPTQFPTSDPITAILLAVTRMEGHMGGALDTLKRHDGTLETHTREIGELKLAVNGLETQASSENRHQAGQLSRRAVLWSAIGALAAVAAIVYTIWATRR